MDFSIVLATPFYEVKAYSPYVTSLMESVKALEQLNIKYDYYEISGDSYVDRAKNSLVQRFLDSDHTHIFMIDSDLRWNVGGFGRLLKAGMRGFEIVGGAYPNKNNWTTFGCMPLKKDGFYVGHEENGMRLLEADGIPGGFILYSREAFERTRPNLNSYYDPTVKKNCLECFRCNVEGTGERVGEDIYFQRRYRECGGKVWLEPDIDFEHFGSKGWKGNYHKYLLRQKTINEATQPMVKVND